MHKSVDLVSRPYRLMATIAIECFSSIICHCRAWQTVNASGVIFGIKKTNVSCTSATVSAVWLEGFDGPEQASVMLYCGQRVGRCQGDKERAESLLKATSPHLLIIMTGLLCLIQTVGAHDPQGPEFQTMMLKAAVRFFERQELESRQQQCHLCHFVPDCRRVCLE